MGGKGSGRPNMRFDPLQALKEATWVAQKEWLRREEAGLGGGLMLHFFSCPECMAVVIAPLTTLEHDLRFYHKSYLNPPKLPCPVCNHEMDAADLAYPGSTPSVNVMRVLTVASVVVKQPEPRPKQNKET